MDRLDALLRFQPSLVIRLALSHCKTREGVCRIHAAEKRGRARRGILRAAERRIEELGGKELIEPVPLIVRGEAIDPDRRAWEQNIATPRIVAAVGRGRRAKGW